MLKRRRISMSVMALLLCATVGGATVARANNNHQRDPLAALERAIKRAGAPALSTDQAAQIRALVTAFQDALPVLPDPTREAARTAYENAILAGDLATAQAQATIIANRTNELVTIRLNAKAQYLIGVLAILKAGGQYDPLVQTFGTIRLLHLLDGLAGVNDDVNNGEDA